MRKITATILSVCGLLAFLTPLAAGFVTKKNPSLNGGLTVATAQSTPTVSKLTAELFSPASYEEYLSLTAPTDSSADEKGIAIADGKRIYYLDKSTDSAVYRLFEHSDSVQKLQIHQNELYFSDASAKLYRLSLEQLKTGTSQAVDTGITCSTFAIHENQLYYTVVTNKTTICRAPLTDLTKKETVVEKLSAFTPLAFWQNELCYFNGNDLFRVSNPEHKIASFPTAVNSMAITGNVFACATTEEAFYVYNLNELRDAENADGVTPLFFAEDGFASLCAQGDFIYAVCNDSVQRFSVSASAFTGYEIGTNSASSHRLNGAKTLTLAENRLFIADNGNKRISVYDTQTQAYLTPISTTLAPSFMASYGNTLLAANEEQAVLYSVSAADQTPLVTLERADIHGTIVGVADVYGKYYFLTDTNHFYTVQKDAQGVWTHTEAQRKVTYGELFTSDIYGNLYVADENAVYRFKEQDFTDPNTEGEKIFTLSKANGKALTIQTDYLGNVYTLYENAIEKYSFNGTSAYPLTETTSLDTPPVYDGNTGFRSLALHAAEENAFLLCNGNYIVKTKQFSSATVKNIPVEEAATKLFDVQNSGTFDVTKIAKNTLLVQFDMQALNGATVFPYLSYERTNEERTALKLGETATNALVAIFNANQGKYATYLAPKSACTDQPQNTYYTEYGETEQKIGYLTNSVHLYKFPYLSELLTASNERLERGTQIKLLGKIEKLDYAYYRIEYGEGESIKTGYIPTTYVNFFEGIPPQTQAHVYGEAESDKDSVFQLVYILLGTFAICVLVDFLILRPRNEN